MNVNFAEFLNVLVIIIEFLELFSLGEGNYSENENRKGLGIIEGCAEWLCRLFDIVGILDGRDEQIVCIHHHSPYSSSQPSIDTHHENRSYSSLQPFSFRFLKYFESRLRKKGGTLNVS